MGVFERMTMDEILKLPDCTMILMAGMFVSVKDLKNAPSYTLEENHSWENKKPEDILNDIKCFSKAIRNTK